MMNRKLVILPVLFAAFGYSTDRSSLWILSREASIPAEHRDSLVKLASGWDFDVSKLEYPE